MQDGMWDAPRPKPVDDSRETRMLKDALAEGWDAEEIATMLGLSVEEAGKRVQAFVRRNAVAMPQG